MTPQHRPEGREQEDGMTEKINSEALDRLLELDGQFYDKPDLVRMARIRADVLHASAAWGSSEDGTLLNWLADEVHRLREALLGACDDLEAEGEAELACHYRAALVGSQP